jgi:hypothetical protein
MLTIAFYQDEKDNEPTSTEVSWAELTEMLTADTPSNCTAATCTGKKCPHKSNSSPDDAGAWSPVTIEGRRANENVEAVTALVLDGDAITEAQLALVAERIKGLSFIVHTTHRHRPGANFIRVALKLSRPVLAAEWASFYPKVIAHLGFDGIFDSLKDLARLYFFPTHPSDVQFLSDSGEGAALDVDAVLAVSKIVASETSFEFEGADDALRENFGGFGNVLLQLKAYRQSRAHGDDKKKEQADLIGKLTSGKPLAAPGGNAEATPITPPDDLPKGRGYAITRVMAILTGYLPSDTPDEVYLDLFKGSIEAMCFGRKDDAKEMEEQVLEKLRIGRERRRAWEEEAQARNTAAKVFQNRLLEERKRRREDAESTDDSENDATSGDKWMSQLQMNTKGENLLISPFNVYLILTNAVEFAGKLRWDDVNLRVVAGGQFAKVEPEVLADEIANHLSASWGITISSIVVLRQILIVAYKNRFDPIRDYLRSAVWDGVSRADNWLTTYANVESTQFSRKAGRKWLIGSAARGLNPGCKHDCVLMLEGLQGKRKSSLFQVMGGEFYAAVSLTVADKDSKMVAARSWIAELPDLAALKRVSEINALKAFFATNEDTFRPPYGREVIKSKRRNSFAGTTNEDSYLIDPTGNRRYLTVKCNATIDLEALQRDRDQLWAEAVYFYDKHAECENKYTCGCWWFSDDEAEEVEEAASERVQESPFKVMIFEWWESMPPETRLREFNTLYIAKNVLEYTPDKINETILTRIGIAMSSLGFEKHRKREGKTRRWIYTPTEELLVLPQSEAGKKMKFKVIKGGVGGSGKPEVTN